MQLHNQDTQVDDLHGPYDQFLLFGDSLTQASCDQDWGFNFHPALQHAFIRRLDVINRGFSGYNTNQAVVVMPKFMPSPEQAKIRFMTIFFGANDSCLPTSTTGQYVPLNDYAQNLEDLVRHPSIVAHKPHLILITPPPVNEYQMEFAERAYGYFEPQRQAENTKKYAERCRQVGEELGVAVLDLWSIMMAKTGWKEGEPLPGSKEVERSDVLQKLLSDGLHFRSPAYEILYESLMELISREWPDEDPTVVPFVFPTWGEAPRK